MQKHGNTVFPGDEVVEISDTKTASPNKGRVVDADPESGRVKVAWDGGGEDWVAMDKLRKGDV